MVGLTMTFSDKILNFHHRSIPGLMPNLIKKSWTVSIAGVHNINSRRNFYGNGWFPLYLIKQTEGKKKPDLSKKV